ncbi:MAG TPA: SOS response-associated peptidase [Gammaproteobacteria bacterium]|nr:SOS response-associated peptidase [Gammaproteobacteria bacterium]
MCGRFTLATPAERIAEHFRLAAVPVLQPRYNIAPSQSIAAVRAAGPQRELVWLRWGLVPAWARDPKVGYRMINARAESLAERPAYRTAFRRRRCLVPADGFYEWKGTGRGKQPYHIRRRDGGPFAIAGLWEHWQSPDGEVIESVTLVTTAANARLAPLHDRMPVLLAPATYGIWLDPELHDTRPLAALLQPCPDDALVTRPVSRRVNDPREDDAGLIEAANEPDRGV